MGQQQLLLVILVTIIVGIATVVAINIFGTAADQANRDAVRQDLMAAAVQAQGVWARPAMMNGADRDFQTYVSNNSVGELLELLNIPSNTFDGSSGTLENENGSYVLAQPGAADELQITATPSSGGDAIIMNLTRDNTTDRWVVDIDGSSTN
jgi:hypothetical protein